MCICIANGLECTDICSYNECTNCLPDEDNENKSEAFGSDTEDQSLNYTTRRSDQCKQLIVFNDSFAHICPFLFKVNEKNIGSIFWSDSV